MTNEILFAGFGGQGILFACKVLAYGALLEDKHVTWLPSYGPEMRGGTCNCSVCVGDTPIGNPLITSPDTLVVMNGPSCDKFIGSVKPDGMVYVDSSLVSGKIERNDVKVNYIPATSLAAENNLEGLANIIILGNVLRHSGLISLEGSKAAIQKCVSAKKQHLLEANVKAIEIGFNYVG